VGGRVYQFHTISRGYHRIFQNGGARGSEAKKTGEGGEKTGEFCHLVHATARKRWNRGRTDRGATNDLSGATHLLGDLSVCRGSRGGGGVKGGGGGKRRKKKVKTGNLTVHGYDVVGIAAYVGGRKIYEKYRKKWGRREEKPAL